MNRIGARKLSAGADTLRFRFMRNRSGATMLTASPASTGKVEVRLDAVRGNETTEKASTTVPLSKLASWFEKVTGLDLMLGQKFSVKEAAPLGRIRVVAPWANAEEVEWALVKAFSKVPTVQRDEGGNAYFDFPGDARTMRRIAPLVKRVGGQVMHLDEGRSGKRLRSGYEAAHPVSGLVTDQAVTKLESIQEAVEPFPIWVSMRPEDVAAGRTPKEAFDAQLADERAGRKTFGGDPRYEDPEPGSAADHLAAMLAVGPYKREPPVWECPKCKGHNGHVREAHADTGMDCQEFHCPDCGHTTEDLETVPKVSSGRTVDTRTGSEVRPFDGKLTQGQMLGEAVAGVNPFMLPWPHQERDPAVERILQRLRAAMGVPSQRVVEALQEDWQDEAGRVWTDAEMDVLYRFKSPSYIISRSAWVSRHFRPVEEGFVLESGVEIHPIRVDDAIGTRRKVESAGWWGPGKYETETLLKRRVYNRGNPTEYIVLETQRLVWNEADDSPVMNEDGSQQGFPQRIAWTPTGLYIGSPREARFLCTKKGIKPEVADESHSVCSIGFNEKEKRWYGWSHRAIAGFGVGDRVFEADFGDDKTPFVKHGREEIRNMRDARRAAVAFASYVS